MGFGQSNPLVTSGQMQNKNLVTIEHNIPKDIPRLRALQSHDLLQDCDRRRQFADCIECEDAVRRPYGCVPSLLGGILGLPHKPDRESEA
jgi:hypothetical protein